MDPEEFSEENRIDTLPEEAGDIELLVRRSDEDMALFDSERIVEALVRERFEDALWAMINSPEFVMVP